MTETDFFRSAKYAPIECRPDLRHLPGPLEQLARLGRHLFDVDLCVVLLPGEAHWLRTMGEALEQVGRESQYLFGQHAGKLIPDTLTLPQLQSNPLVCHDPGIRFLAHAYVAGEDQTTLDIFLADREPRHWTDERSSLFGDFLAIGRETLNSGLRERKLLNLSEENHQLRRWAAVDPLTSLWNRDSILDILDREISRCFRQRLPISIIVADLDHFKDVNDRHGHLAGDAVLGEVGQRLRRAVRTYDAVGRVGGEEFLIVMSSCSEPEAAAVAERIHHAIRSRPILVGEGQVGITISQGLVTCAGEKRISPLELFEKADKALYAAKALGRDGIRRDTECSGYS